MNIVCVSYTTLKTTPKSLDFWNSYNLEKKQVSINKIFGLNRYSVMVPTYMVIDYS